jgi:hypothetical protein
MYMTMAYWESLVAIRKGPLLFQVEGAEPVLVVTDAADRTRGWGWCWNWVVVGMTDHESGNK